ncbi:MAG: DNA mismatch repair protein MutS [Chrysiogenetes bacterium]|nr:DNA mismatch repair protein MutS [Chrysiogenetes bacterium]
MPSAENSKNSPKIKLTPAMQQYMDAKQAYPDALVFFRMGDFYELFFEDATIAAPVLEIALTTRDKNKGADSIPMCGVPHHAATGHIRRLTERGYKVAICEQVEDPAQAKGLVKREVTRLVTPGMPLDEGASGQRNHYVLALAPGKKAWGVAAVDAATGSFPAAEVPESQLIAELSRLSPAELVIAEGTEMPQALEDYLRAWPRTLTERQQIEFKPERAERLLEEQFELGSLGSFGFEPGSPALAAAGAVVAYLREANKTGVAHVRELHPFHPGQGLVIDESSRENLEIFRSQSDRTERGSLVGALDLSVSAAGARCLRRWLGFPLLDVQRINERLDAVAELKDSGGLRESLREGLSQGGDLERIIGRICQGRANPRDLIALATTLEQIPAFRASLEGAQCEALEDYAARMNDLAEIRTRIRGAVVEDPPATVGDGGVFQKGVSEDLDSIREIRTGGKEWIARLEATERERTGISSLKIRYNRVFGYYIEVTKANAGGVPEDYIRKQTLTNAERYITPELKEYEEKVLSAGERIRAIEQELFGALCEEIAANVAAVQELARALAELDVLCCFAELASKHGYVRPAVHEGKEICIRDGRHPVVEAFLPAGERFVPNDLDMDGEGAQLLLITGPNMAGKSTVMRQVAILVLLSQVGCFVPAAEARIGLVDRIFTRVGASDNLARGLSTFMLEMTETAGILRQATSRSLILMDEIGRGTSTFDGLSIAWAVAESLHDLSGEGVRTLFATHYHELAELEQLYPRVKNLTMSVKEWNERILFLRKLVPGAASHSYGIHVARLAGIPDGVIDRARQILSDLEAGEWDPTGSPRIKPARKGGAAHARADTGQLSLLSSAGDRVVAELKRELEGVNPDELTPLDALTWITKWKERLTKP